jgi:hypothetical protein
MTFYFDSNIKRKCLNLVGHSPKSRWYQKIHTFLAILFFYIKMAGLDKKYLKIDMGCQERSSIFKMELDGNLNFKKGLKTNVASEQSYSPA